VASRPCARLHPDTLQPGHRCHQLTACWWRSLHRQTSGSVPGTTPARRHLDTLRAPRQTRRHLDTPRALAPSRHPQTSGHATSAKGIRRHHTPPARLRTRRHLDRALDPSWHPQTSGHATSAKGTRRHLDTPPAQQRFRRQPCTRRHLDPRSGPSQRQHTRVPQRDRRRCPSAHQRKLQPRHFPHFHTANLTQYCSFVQLILTAEPGASSFASPSSPPSSPPPLLSPPPHHATQPHRAPRPGPNVVLAQRADATRRPAARHIGSRTAQVWPLPQLTTWSTHVTRPPPPRPTRVYRRCRPPSSGLTCCAPLSARFRTPMETASTSAPPRRASRWWDCSQTARSEARAA